MNMNMNYKNHDTKFTEPSLTKDLDQLLDQLSLEEIERLIHYLRILELSNRLSLISIIGYILATAFIVIKYIITNDITLSIQSFIVPQSFALIVLLISFKVDRYSMDKIKAIEDIAKTRYLRENNSK